MRCTERRAAWLALAAAACAVVLIGQAVAVAVLAAVAWGLWRAGWIGSRYRIGAVCWLADGRWVLTDHRGAEIPAELSDDTRQVRGAVWLRWKTGPGCRQSMLLTPADVPAGQLRALRVRLQIEAPAAVPTKVVERAWPEARTR